MSGTVVRAYAVRVRGRDNETIINARSPGQAKREFFLDLDGCLPDLKFTDLRCRVHGAPYTSQDFTRNAVYRGMPALRCGDRVRVGDAIGVVVGHNASANLDVLFNDESPKYAGLRLNVHPSGVEVLPVSTQRHEGTKAQRGDGK